MEKSDLVRKIIAFPRLHLTLIGLDSDRYRLNGGVGFAINDPKIVFTGKQSTHFTISGPLYDRLSLNHREKLIEKLESVKTKYNFKSCISINTNSSLFPHSGFGTGTIIRLASIELLFLLNNTKYSANEIIQVSGRGGTSGIGVNTYFEGGFVFDIGIKNQGEQLGPSSTAEKRKKKPLLFKHHKMPSWDIGICIAPKILELISVDETALFSNVCPIGKEHVNEVLYHVVYGLTAAIMEKDKSSFMQAIASLQNCIWKNSERALYGEELLKIEDILLKAGAQAVGMSSVGPALFFLGNNVSEIIRKTKTIESELIIFKTRPNNSGRIIV